MRLERLSKEQLEVVYMERMVEDFPPGEIKPLEMMYRAMDREIYECFGLYREEEPVGYTCLVKVGKDYLIDYLATYPKVRNQGFGGELIRLLGEYLREATSIIGEVENPDFANTKEEQVLQQRRYDFYLRNGFRDTGVRAVCFGVPYRLIEMGEGLCHNAEEMKRLYRMQYKVILPTELYEKNIEV